MQKLIQLFVQLLDEISIMVDDMFCIDCFETN